MTTFQFFLLKKGGKWIVRYGLNSVDLLGEDPRSFLAKLEKDFAEDVFVHKRIEEKFAYFKIVAIKVVKRFPIFTDLKDVPPEKQVQKLIVEGKLSEVFELEPSYVEKLEGNKWLVVIPAQEALKPPKGYPKPEPKKICARCYNTISDGLKPYWKPSNEKGNCDICGLHDVGLFILSGEVK
jgi:hypothetical protein